MTDRTLTTYGDPPKRADARPAHSFASVGHAFDACLDLLARALQASQDMDALSSWDPAFAAWRAAEETLWDQTAVALRQTFEGEAHHPADRPVIRMALLLHAALGCESATELARFLALPARHAVLFAVAGDGPEAERANALLDRARALLTRLSEQSLGLAPPIAPSGAAGPELCRHPEALAL